MSKTGSKVFSFQLRKSCAGNIGKLRIMAIFN